MSNHEQTKNTCEKLFEYFKITNEHRKSEINESLTLFDSIPAAYTVVYSVEAGKFIYLSFKAKELLDYPIKYRMNQGVTPRVALRLMKWQSAFAEKIAADNFDYTVPLLTSSYEALNQDSTTAASMYQSGIVLEFEPGGDVRTFIGISILMDKTSNKLPVTKMQLNRKLKDLHTLLLGPFSGRGKYDNSALIKIKAPYYQSPRLTKKEKELLLLLSQGGELKNIANQMNVSYFTSEAHRKNLFEKFEVHNVAELIQKASKMYWLE